MLDSATTGTRATTGTFTLYDTPSTSMSSFLLAYFNPWLNSNHKSVKCDSKQLIV